MFALRVRMSSSACSVRSKASAADPEGPLAHAQREHPADDDLGWTVVSVHLQNLGQLARASPKDVGSGLGVKSSRLVSSLPRYHSSWRSSESETLQLDVGQWCAQSNERRVLSPAFRGRKRRNIVTNNF